MTTTAIRFQRAGEIFQSAAKLDPALREPFIIEQSNGDAELLSQVRALLRADELPPGVLDQPALGEGLSLAAVETAISSAGNPPERIGRYRIIRVIGEGGMGVVYEAQQDEPRRRVALKVIRPGMMSGNLLRRFRHEAEMLGRLKHPGIAQIYEAGTADHGEGGQPYFAMELVDGRPLLEHAELHRLGTRQRLELMARICDAVHHAHLNGVIHRDLKPVNILVVDEGTEALNLDGAASSLRRSFASPLAQPKILDFGIARAIEADIQTVTLRTDIGQLLGTIAYMSPEQAAGDPAHLDVRSDVYALGVIAYELLAGRLPYSVQGKLVHEAVRVIREDEPSRLSSISRMFRGDVETIIAKALEKEKERRYQSAAEFASDVRRYLSEQPIAARPASRLYQLSKFARRNKAIVGGVVIAFAALAIGTAISITQAIEARAAASDARRQTYKASLVAASSALRYHETRDAQRHLEVAPQELRGWEWDHLTSRVDDSLMTLHTGFIPMCFALSPDGQTLASCGSAGHIRLWRLEDLSVVATHKLAGSVPQRRVKRLVFSHDGRELRADKRAGSVRLDAVTLAEIARDDLVFLERSPANDFGAAARAGQERGLVIVEISTGREVVSLSCRDGNDAVIEFLSDSSLVAVCLPDRGLTIHRTSNGEPLSQRPELNQILDLAFNTDGTRIALASADGTVVVLDTRTGSQLVSMVGHMVSASAVAFSPDETLIATASGDRTVRLWRGDDGSPVALMHGNQGAIVDLIFTPDGDKVVTASSDRKIRWWDATRTCDPFVLPTPGTPYGVAFSQDGERIIAACLGGDRPLRVWDAGTGAEVLATSEGPLSALGISADGELLGIGRSGRGESSILRADGAVEATLPGHPWRTDWVAFRDGDRQVLTLGNDGRLIAYDASSGARVQSQQFTAESEGHGCRAAINSAGTLIAVAGRNQIALIDFKTWEVLGTMQADAGNVYALAFSPDGARLVSGSSDGRLRVWDVAGRTLTATLASHSDEVYAVIFSPDGTRFFSAGRDRVIRVWDGERLEEITQLHGHTSLIYCMAFSPDGATLASGGGDATVRLWDTKPYRERRR